MLAQRLSSAQLAAVGASIAAHAAVALGIALHQPASADLAQPPQAINVSLVNAADLFPASAPPAPAAPRPAERPRTSASNSHAAPAPTAAPAAPRIPAPAPPAMVEATQLAQDMAPQPVFLATTTPPPRSTVDPLVEYRRLIWSHLAANAPAARPGAGVAVAIFALDESGAILSVRLGRSSGDPLFDRACLRAIRAAAPLPTPPPGTSRDKLVFELPIKARAS